jgi:threonine aldolase
VRFGVTSLPAGEFVDELHANGLYVLPSGADGVRAIPYLNISRQQIQQAIAIIATVTEAHAAAAGTFGSQTGLAAGAGY